MFVWNIDRIIPSFLFITWLGQSQFSFQPLWLLVARIVFPSLLWASPPSVYSSGRGICFWQWGNLSFPFQRDYLVNSLANCSNRSFQNIEFNPPSLDRRGHPIDYQPSSPISRMGSTAPSLKKLMRTHAAPMIMTCQSPKCKVIPGATQKATTGKRLRRIRPSAAQVNDSHSSNWCSIFLS